MKTQIDTLIDVCEVGDCTDMKLQISYWEGQNRFNKETFNMQTQVTTPFDLKRDYEHTLEFWIQNEGGVEAYYSKFNPGKTKTSELSPDTDQCTRVYRNYWLETFADGTLRQPPAIKPDCYSFTEWFTRPIEGHFSNRTFKLSASRDYQFCCKAEQDFWYTDKQLHKMFIRVITETDGGVKVVGRSPYFYFDVGTFKLTGQAKTDRESEIVKEIKVLEDETQARRKEEERLLKEKIAREYQEKLEAEAQARFEAAEKVRIENEILAKIEAERLAELERIRVERMSVAEQKRYWEEKTEQEIQRQQAHKDALIKEHKLQVEIMNNHQDRLNTLAKEQENLFDFSESKAVAGALISSSAIVLMTLF